MNPGLTQLYAQLYGRPDELFDEPEPPARRRSSRCQCDDVPGNCPGPTNCPYSDQYENDDR